MAQTVLSWLKELGVPALLLAVVTAGARALLSLRRRGHQAQDFDILSSPNTSTAVQTDADLAVLVSEARRALIFEATFGFRAEAGCRAALTQFWRDCDGRFTMPEIGQAARRLRWDGNRFTFRHLTARGSLGLKQLSLRRWMRTHFAFIQVALILFAYAYLYWFANGVRFSDPFVWINAAMALAFMLAPVWQDWQLRRLEVADELLEWSESYAKQGATEASSPQVTAQQLVGPERRERVL